MFELFFYFSALIAKIWLLSLLIGSIIACAKYSFMNLNPDTEKNKCSLSFALIHPKWIGLTSWIILVSIFCVIVALYIQILVVLCRKISSKFNHKQESTKIKGMSLRLAFYVIIWCPIFILMFLLITEYQINYHHEHAFIEMLSYLHASINPFFYGFTMILVIERFEQICGKPSKRTLMIYRLS